MEQDIRHVPLDNTCVTGPNYMMQCCWLCVDIACLWVIRHMLQQCMPLCILQWIMSTVVCTKLMSLLSQSHGHGQSVRDLSEHTAIAGSKVWHAVH